jgi:hypothetical protein
MIPSSYARATAASVPCLEGIGLALDIPGDRMFMTDLGGSLGCSRVRIYRFADLKGGSSSQTYRQGCNRPLRVQKAGRHNGTIVIAQPNRLLLLSDQDAYTGPTIMPQSRRGSRAQGHDAHILCGEWVARL